MTPLAEAMQLVFLASWCVALLSVFYANRYFLPMWAVGFRRRERHKGYPKKVAIGTGIFFLAILVGLAAGAVAETWGGGWE